MKKHEEKTHSVIELLVREFNRRVGQEILRYSAELKNLCFSQRYEYTVYILYPDKERFEKVKKGLTQSEFITWLCGYLNAPEP